MAGIRILHHHSIVHSDLLRGHSLLSDFTCEFECLYYQCMEARIHFVQQSIHLLTHMGPETFRIDPLVCYAQWTLKIAMSNLSHEIQQDQDLFANLTQQVVM